MSDQRRVKGHTSSRRLGTFGVAIVLLATGAIAGAVLREAPATHDGRAAVPGVSLVDFDGKTFTLADYRGSPLVVHFWASWCPSCAAEMPAFENVYQEVNRELEFVGINNNDSRDAAEELARSTSVTYRLAHDPRGDVFATLGGAGMPTTVFIDESGRVVETVVGALSEDQLSALIEKHLRITG
jgi:cytochrome c biogenesis protein CcmG/thiol:disulfide interchange protein DsbE